MLMSKHTGLSFKLLQKRSMFKNALWLSGIASVLLIPIKEYLGSNTVK